MMRDGGPCCSNHETPSSGTIGSSTTPSGSSRYELTSKPIFGCLAVQCQTPPAISSIIADLSLSEHGSHNDRDVELGRSWLRRGVVSEGDAGARPAGLVRRPLRRCRAELE